MLQRSTFIRALLATQCAVDNTIVCGALQYIAVRSSVLQCVLLCCSALQYIAVCLSVSLCVAVCCSVLQCGATVHILKACCSVLQCGVVCCSAWATTIELTFEKSALQCIAVCCSMSQCLAVSCSVLQCVTVRGQRLLK